MYNKTVLKNGTKIISEKLDHYRSVSLGMFVSVGSRDEREDDSGITHFIEHMIFKGTRNRNSLQIAKELDAVGGFSNAFTSKEYTCFHARVLDNHFPVIADILSDIFLNSVFDPLEIDRERMVILQEIGMVDDCPDEYIHEMFSSLFWRNHPLGRSVLGTTETVSSIHQGTVLEYIKRYYTPERIIISATGNVEHKALIEFFEPLFDLLEQGNAFLQGTSPQVYSGVSSVYKDLEQVHICLGGIGPHLSNDLRFAGAILNTVLGGNMSSRLFQEIREKRGLAYSVYSFLNSYLDTGLLGVYAATDPKKVNTALDIINREIRKIRDGEISGSDLDDAREHLIGGILLGAESTDARMMRNAKNEYVFGRYVSYEELVESLKRVTVDEVISCAQEAFRSERISLATLGPVHEADLELDSMKFD